MLALLPDGAFGASTLNQRRRQMTHDQLGEQITQLRAALPILKEKANMGLIHFDSHAKAESMIHWYERFNNLSEKQVLYVGRLLQRARRKHKNVDLTFTGGGGGGKPVDERAIAAKVIEQIGDNRVNVQDVIDGIMPRVLEAVENRVPRKVEIVVTKADGKTHKVKGPTHMNFDKLLRAANSRLPNGYAPGIFLQGEASSGKSTAGSMLAEALSHDYYFNGAITFPHEMLGFIDGGGHYHRTPFRDAYEHGGVYMFDEVDRSDPNALLAVNPHLANGLATFPDKQIKRHKNCIIICSANTWGLGADANYSGATKLDAAFLSRFPIRINWDIDEKLEEAIVENPEWLAHVRKARERARLAGLKVLIDVRIAQAGAALIAQGFSLTEAAEMTYLANMKPDQRKQVGG